MNPGKIPVFCACMFFTGHVAGQYASGVTIPDPQTPLVSDLTDESYMLSTTINESDLSRHLYVLASDDFEGRETGMPGIEKASAYIESYFSDLQLPRIGERESYHQEVAFTFTSWKKIEVRRGEKIYRQLRDFIAFPQFSEEMESFSADEIIFAGFGIQHANYADLKEGMGEVCMVFDGEPMKDDGTSWLTGTQELSQWSEDWMTKSRAAKENGIKLLLIVSSDIKKIINENRRLMINNITELGDRSNMVSEGANTIFISPSMAQDLLDQHREEVIAMRNHVNATGVPFKGLVIPSDLVVDQVLTKRVVKGRNMLGFVEGTSRKEEVIVLSAHYDHVGKKGNSIFNGADDNGSGTSTVLELLEALATAKKMGRGPERSVLCMLVTGEEKGLLGSQYYTENPIFPIEKTIANINIDMVGRRDKKYELSGQDYVYVIGSDRLSKDLHDINEDMNRRYSGLVLDYQFNDEADPNRFYYRSDHYNFARKGIPAIFFFNGVHDDYHRASDTVDKIDFTMMTKRARLIFHTTWELANRKERIKKLGEVSTD